MEGLLAADLAQARFRSRLLAAFALTALALAAIGIFGVVSYAARRRHREVGIRMALGADRRAVQSLVIREGMVPVGLGLAAGLAAALVLTRLLAEPGLPGGRRRSGDLPRRPPPAGGGGPALDLLPFRMGDAGRSRWRRCGRSEAALLLP